MVEKVSKKEESDGSFYSDLSYRFHGDADDLPLMNQQEINELGKSIRESGQLDDIVLIGSLIIDGRNRYLACRNEGITPRYRYYDNHLDTHEYVYNKNVLRRHLTPTQKSKAIIKHLEIERKRAKQRMARTQFDGKTKDNRHKLKSSASYPGLLTEGDLKKGRSIDLVAKKFEMSPKTVKKIENVNKIAKNNPFIKKYWERAQEDNDPLEKIYRTILNTLDIHRNRNQNAYIRLNEWKKKNIIRAHISMMENVIQNATNLEKKIKNEASLKFIQEGIKYTESKKKSSELNNEICDEKDMKERFCLDLDCPEIEKYKCIHCEKLNYLCIASKIPVVKHPEDKVCFRYIKRFYK